MSTYGMLGGCLFPNVMQLDGSHAYCVAHQRRCKVDPPLQSDEERFLAATGLEQGLRLYKNPDCKHMQPETLSAPSAIASPGIPVNVSGADLSKPAHMHDFFKSHSVDFLSRIQAVTLCMSKLLQLIIGLTGYILSGIYLRPSVRGFFFNGKKAGNQWSKLEAAQKVLPAVAKIHFPRGGDRKCPWIFVGFSQERAEQGRAAMGLW